jgi:hypothetical protein
LTLALVNMSDNSFLFVTLKALRMVLTHPSKVCNGGMTMFSGFTVNNAFVGGRNGARNAEFSRCSPLVHVQIGQKDLMRGEGRQ